MADILLTHSYILRLDPKEYRAMMPYAPLGTLYAASALRNAGFTVALFDSMLADSEQEISRALDSEKPGMLVIYDDDFNYLTKMCLSRMRDAAVAMIAVAKERGCRVVVHGSDPADHAGFYLDNGADFIAVGEGEVTLTELVLSLEGKSAVPPSAIPGVAYRDGGSVRMTAKRPVLKELDALPLPARDLVDIERYRALWKRRHGYFSMNIVTTRGCPFHCNWCAKPIYGQVYHSRSPECVVDEMLQLRASFRPDHLWFCDDIFGLKPGWVPAFADAVERRGAHTPFKCLSRADLLLHDETVRHLARAGCRSVWIGAESGSQKILDAMEKGITVDQIYRSARLLRQYGIRVGFFLQYGYPGETREDIDRTLAMVRECTPDEIGISVSYPLPGTRFYENVRRQLGEKQNWIDSQDLALLFHGTFEPEFYRALHAVTHKKLRIWQGQQTLKSLAAHPLAVRKVDLRSMAAMAYHAATLPRIESALNRAASLHPPA